MNNQRTKKLALHRETLKHLDAAALRHAGGAQADQLFGSRICITPGCKSRGDDPTCLGQTCTSCDGPVSCKEPCITTQPY